MICPSCGTENQMAYSVLSNGLICLDPHCSFELEMSADEAQQLTEPLEELALA